MRRRDPLEYRTHLEYLHPEESLEGPHNFQVSFENGLHIWRGVSRRLPAPPHPIPHREPRDAGSVPTTLGYGLLTPAWRRPPRAPACRQAGLPENRIAPRRPGPRRGGEPILFSSTVPLRAAYFQMGRDFFETGPGFFLIRDPAFPRPDFNMMQDAQHYRIPADLGVIDQHLRDQDAALRIDIGFTCAGQ